MKKRIMRTKKYNINTKLSIKMIILEVIKKKLFSITKNMRKYMKKRTLYKYY